VIPLPWGGLVLWGCFFLNRSGIVTRFRFSGYKVTLAWGSGFLFLLHPEKKTGFPPARGARGGGGGQGRQREFDLGRAFFLGGLDQNKTKDHFRGGGGGALFGNLCARGENSNWGCGNVGIRGPRGRVLKKNRPTGEISFGLGWGGGRVFVNSPKRGGGDKGARFVVVRPGFWKGGFGKEKTKKKTTGGAPFVNPPNKPPCFQILGGPTRRHHWLGGFLGGIPGGTGGAWGETQFFFFFCPGVRDVLGGLWNKGLQTSGAFPVFSKKKGGPLGGCLTPWPGGVFLLGGEPDGGYLFFLFGLPFPSFFSVGCLF